VAALARKQLTVAFSLYDCPGPEAEHAKCRSYSSQDRICRSQLDSSTLPRAKASQEDMGLSNSESLLTRLQLHARLAGCNDKSAVLSANLICNDALTEIEY
jgi:hypothetical protein